MKADKVSLVSVVAACSCCLPPLILLGLTLIGVGTAGLAGLSATLGAVKWYLMSLAVLGLAVSYLLYFREKRRCAASACRMANERFTRTMLVVSTIVVVGFLSWSVYPYVFGTPAPVAAGSGDSGHLAVFEVDGMTCGGCELSVNGAVTATGLADSVKSSFVDSRTWVWYSGDSARVSRFAEAIRNVGYEHRLLELQ